MISTKDQEREALKKIKEIVAGLGEDSYIAAAFDGCFELAENNIDNDFADSMKQIADSARKALETVKEEKMQLQREARDLSEMAEALADEKDRLNKEIKAASEKIDVLEAERENILSESAENARKYNMAEEDNKALRAEIIQLKAKLYDYIIKEQEG